MVMVMEKVRYLKKGGVEKHKLTVSELPSHNHSMQNAGNHNHRTIDQNVGAKQNLEEVMVLFQEEEKQQLVLLTIIVIYI